MPSNDRRGLEEQAGGGIEREPERKRPKICRSRPVNSASGSLRMVTALASKLAAFRDGSVT